MDKAATSTGEARSKLSACYQKLASHHLEKEGDIAKYHAVQEKHWRMWEKAEAFEKAAEILGEISKVCEEKGDVQKKREATSALGRNSIEKLKSKLTNLVIEHCTALKKNLKVN